MQLCQKAEKNAIKFYESKIHICISSLFMHAYLGLIISNEKDEVVMQVRNSAKIYMY